MKFRPLHDRILVRRVEEENRTTGGIIIPDTAKEKPIQGEVLAVVRVIETKPARSCRSTCVSAIAFCSANGQVLR